MPIQVALTVKRTLDLQVHFRRYQSKLKFHFSYFTYY